jgi:hypothetical protein
MECFVKVVEDPVTSKGRETQDTPDLVHVYHKLIAFALKKESKHHHTQNHRTA